MSSVVLFVLFTISMTSGAFAAEENSEKYLQPTISMYDQDINVKVNENFWVCGYQGQTPNYDSNYVELVDTEWLGNIGPITPWIKGAAIYQFKAIKSGETIITIPGDFIIYTQGSSDRDYNPFSRIYHVTITE